MSHAKWNTLRLRLDTNENYYLLEFFSEWRETGKKTMAFDDALSSRRWNVHNGNSNGNVSRNNSSHQLCGSGFGPRPKLHSNENERLKHDDAEWEKPIIRLSSLYRALRESHPIANSEPMLRHNMIFVCRVAHSLIAHFLIKSKLSFYSEMVSSEAQRLAELEQRSTHTHTHVPTISNTFKSTAHKGKINKYDAHVKRRLPYLLKFWFLFTFFDGGVDGTGGWIAGWLASTMPLTAWIK